MEGVNSITGLSGQLIRGTPPPIVKFVMEGIITVGV